MDFPWQLPSVTKLISPPASTTAYPSSYSSCLVMSLSNSLTVPNPSIRDKKELKCSHQAEQGQVLTFEWYPRNSSEDLFLYIVRTFTIFQDDDLQSKEPVFQWRGYHVSLFRLRVQNLLKGKQESGRASKRRILLELSKQWNGNVRTTKSLR